MASEEPQTAESPEDDEAKSALRDNIDRKGKNAYYFAHAKTATGPVWDGKAEPKLLGAEDGYSSSPKVATPLRAASFDIHKSNITSYAFSDEGKNVRLYITLQNIGECCKEDDIALNYSESSFCLTVQNYQKKVEGPKENRCLMFNKLTANITNAKCKLKQDRIVLTLTKEDPDSEWHTINDKGAADHEVV